MTICVSVVYSSRARRTHEEWVTLDDHATVLQAVQASAVLRRFPEIDLTRVQVGVWNCKSSLQQRLQEHDRVEIYRPLAVDPKLARRERFKRQGVRAAGLFSNKRPGSAASD